MQHVWDYLIFRDHWQGEFCVALFGAIGWAAIGLAAPEDLVGLPQYDMLVRLGPQVCWEVGFILFGFLQLMGLFLNSALLRAIGATGILIGLVVAFLGVMIKAPWTLGLSMYLACIGIEFCAIIFQVAVVVRYQEHKRWMFKR